MMMKMTYGLLVCITLWIATFFWEVKKQRVKIRLTEKYNEIRNFYVKCLLDILEELSSGGLR